MILLSPAPPQHILTYNNVPSIIHCLDDGLKQTLEPTHPDWLQVNMSILPMNLGTQLWGSHSWPISTCPCRSQTERPYQCPCLAFIENLCDLLNLFQKNTNPRIYLTWEWHRKKVLWKGSLTLDLLYAESIEEAQCCTKAIFNIYKLLVTEI